MKLILLMTFLTVVIFAVGTMAGPIVGGKPIIVPLTADPGPSNASVVGGTNDADEKYPYMVYIRIVRSPPEEPFLSVCGGSIISKRFILTAAHCIQDFSPTHVTVKYGTTKADDSNTVYRAVERLIPHENYKQLLNIHEYDIGLIELKNEIRYNRKVQPIKLPPSDNFTGNITAVLTGWGDLYHQGHQPNELHHVALNIDTPDDCVNVICDMIFQDREYDEIYEWKLDDVNLTTRRDCKRTGTFRNNICTSSFGKEETGFCFGDSGSPLVVGNYQLGIASLLGEWFCGDGSNISTKVHPYLDWIKKHSGLLYSDR